MPPPPPSLGLGLGLTRIRGDVGVGQTLRLEVTGAGTTSVNGTYTQYKKDPHLWGGKAAFTNDAVENSSPDTAGIFWDGAAFQITIDGGDFMYSAGEDVSFPWDASHWDVEDGDAPGPTVTQITA